MKDKRNKIAIITAGLAILVLIGGLAMAAAEIENQTGQAQGLRRGQGQGLRQGQGQGLRQGQGQGLRRGAALENQAQEETAGNQGRQLRAGQEFQRVMQELTPEQRQVVRREIARRVRRQVQVRRNGNGVSLDLSLQVPNRVLPGPQARQRIRAMRQNQLNLETEVQAGERLENNNQIYIEEGPQVEIDSPEQQSNVQSTTGTGRRARQRQGAGRALQQNSEIVTE